MQTSDPSWGVKSQHVASMIYIDIYRPSLNQTQVKIYLYSFIERFGPTVENQYSFKFKKWRKSETAVCKFKDSFKPQYTLEPVFSPSLMLTRLSL